MPEVSRVRTGKGHWPGNEHRNFRSHYIPHSESKNGKNSLSRVGLGSNPCSLPYFVGLWTSFSLSKLVPHLVHGDKKAYFLGVRGLNEIKYKRQFAHPAHVIIHYRRRRLHILEQTRASFYQGAENTEEHAPPSSARSDGGVTSSGRLGSLVSHMDVTSRLPYNQQVTVTQHGIT